MTEAKAPPRRRRRNNEEVVFVRNLLTADAVSALVKERESQDEKWGEQHHPLTVRRIGTGNVSRAAQWKMLEQTMKRENVVKSRHGKLDWSGILKEEYAEFMYFACLDNLAEAQKEIMQVAAVAIAIWEDIERHKAERRDGTV